VARARLSRVSHCTPALVLRRVAYRDADWIVTLLTEQLGVVSALARSGRTSQRRFGGGLEPIHTLHVHLDEVATDRLLTLHEARIEIARHRVVTSLDAMQAAGRALLWVRRAAPERIPEPAVWRVVSTLLDHLNDGNDQRSAHVHLAECGLALLVALGWGIEFERCVVSGQVCEKGRSAMVDPVRGGLVSQACGGARILLEGAVRERMARAAREQPRALEEGDAELALSLVEQALRAHADLG